MPEDDLGCHTGRVQHNAVGLDHVREAVFGDQHEESGSDADQSVCPKPGVLLSDLTLKADQRGEDESQSKFSQLQPALTGDFSYHQRLLLLPSFTGGMSSITCGVSP